MRVTRRSAEPNTFHSSVPARKRNNYIPKDIISQGNGPIPCIGLVSWSLLKTCISQIQPNIWYSVIPRDGQNDDIASGTRQSWQDIMPLLIHTGLMKKNSQASNGFDVFHHKWDEFVLDFESSSKLHFIGARKKGQSQQYFLCLGKPIFMSPAKQEKAIASKVFVFDMLTYMSNEDKELHKMIKTHLSTSLLAILSPSPAPAAPAAPSQVLPPTSPAPHVPSSPTQVLSPASPPPSVPIPEPTPAPTPTPTPIPVLLPQAQPTPPAPFAADIAFALTLNFESVPRLHRMGDEHIMIHKRKQAGELHRICVMFTAKLWGADDPLLTVKERQRIRTAAVHLIAYDYGF